MSYEASVFNVMIASPGDVTVLRAIVREEVYDWNVIHSTKNALVLLPVGWETHSSPNLNGQRAQDILNDQVLDQCDLLVGIFGSRLGTSTGKHESGTVEEIKEHMAAGKPAMVYFYTGPENKDVEHFDPEQHRQVQEFLKWCKGQGLYETYDSTEVFRRKFSRHLALTVNRHLAFNRQGTPITRSVASSEKSPDSEPEPAASGQLAIAGITDKSSAEIGQLTPEALQMLKAGSLDPSGVILAVEYLDGQDFQTNNETLNKSKDARTIARWERAINQLMDAGLLNVTTNRNGFRMYKLTVEGYEIADVIPDQP